MALKEHMTPRTLARCSGAALVTGSALMIVAHLLYKVAGPQGTAAQIDSELWVPAHALQLGAGVLVLIGLPAVYARQAERLGVFGLISFALLFIGITTEVVGPAHVLWTAELAGRAETRPLVEARIMPFALGVILFSGLVTLWVGAIAFGVSVIRARVFAPAAGVLLIVSIVLDLVGGFTLRASLFGPELALTALAWLGVQLVVGTPGATRTSLSESVATTV